jgi:TPR repeat protein
MKKLLLLAMAVALLAGCGKKPVVDQQAAERGEVDQALLTEELARRMEEEGLPETLLKEEPFKGLFEGLFEVAKAKADKEKPSFFEATKAKAEKGDAYSQNLLGVMYDDGKGVEQDFKEAVKWCRKAADQGYVNAQTNLGTMYDNGEGVLEDDKEAFKWFRKAADQGHANAQYNLGVMYDVGKGVGKDFVTAYAWWNIAVANGEEDAKENKELIAKEMTPAQITEAEALVKEMVKKNPKLLKK